MHQCVGFFPFGRLKSIHESTDWSVYCYLVVVTLNISINDRCQYDCEYDHQDEGGHNPALLVGSMVLCVVVVTQLNNTSTVSLLTPVLAGIGQTAGLDSTMYAGGHVSELCFYAAVSTPPNVIILGRNSAYHEMMRVGFWLNL